MNLTEFITDRHLIKPSSKLHWECASECFAKWFSGVHPNTVLRRRTTKTVFNNSTTGSITNVTKNFPEYADDYDEHEYKLQLEEKGRDVAFNGYHLVVVSEWLKNDKYVKSIERLFDVKGIGRREWMICRVPTKNANNAVPLNVTADEMSILKEANQIDTRLYNDLKICGADGNGTPVFDGRKPFRFVSLSSASSPS